MGNFTAKWIVWIAPFLCIQAFAQKPEYVESTPIENILAPDVIDAILSAPRVTITRLDSGSTAMGTQSINAVKKILLDGQTYIVGAKRSCQFIPKSVFKFDSRSDQACNVSFSSIYCPKVQIDVGKETVYLDLSEKGAQKISELLHSSRQVKNNDDDTRVQILLFSYLLEKQDSDLIVDLHNDKFFNILPAIRRSGRRPIYHLQLDQQSEQIFHRLEEMSLIMPLRKKISSGEVKVSKTNHSN